VTRDSITDSVQWKDAAFELVDRAGISFRKKEDTLDERIRLQALKLVDTVNLILFMVDGQSGFVTEDAEIAKALHKAGKKVILVINKMDVKIAQEHVHEFARLGFKDVQEISATHSTGITELLNFIVEKIGSESAPDLPAPTFRVAFLGKPNVGKSSLLNALLQEERSLVTDVPGTTRQAIAERIQFYQENIELVDTPGVRRPRSIGEQLESMMVKSALAAVRGADIVLLVVDVSAHKLSNQELTLAYYAFQEQYKGLIMIFNKQDLMVDDLAKEDLKFNLSEYKFFLDTIMTLNVSAITGKNVGKIIPTINDLWKRYNTTFAKPELQLLFKNALTKTPLYKTGVPLKLHRAEQLSTAPITIALYTHQVPQFGASQLKFFENVLRAHTDLRGVPVKFVVRPRGSASR
jgi:GTP-binding protein